MSVNNIFKQLKKNILWKNLYKLFLLLLFFFFFLKNSFIKKFKSILMCLMSWSSNKRFAKLKYIKVEEKEFYINLSWKFTIYLQKKRSMMFRVVTSFQQSKWNDKYEGICGHWPLLKSRIFHLVGTSPFLFFYSFFFFL